MKDKTKERKVAEIIGHSPIFKDVDVALNSDSVWNLLQISELEKGQFLFYQGSTVDFIGIVVEGSLAIIKETIDGRRTIISHLSKGDHFAEAISFLRLEESPVSVVAMENSIVVKLSIDNLMNSLHLKDSITIMRNLMELGARKNLLLQNRLDILSQTNIEDKVICFLQQRKGSSEYITIPFNRQEMAEFLCVDRTALSHQLSKMKKKGILDYYKNNFKLL